jgi:hypothetical protein
VPVVLPLPLPVAVAVWQWQVAVAWAGDEKNNKWGQSKKSYFHSKMLKNAPFGLIFSLF